MEVKFAIGACVCLMIWLNHFCRDGIGALSLAIMEGYDISSGTFTMLTGTFFMPSLVVPFVAGLVSTKIGAPMTILITMTIFAIANVLVGCSAGVFMSVPLLSLGRLMHGMVYEVIDTIPPFALMFPLFPGNFGTVLGIVAFCFRSSSLAAFAYLPWVNASQGLASAMAGYQVAGIFGLGVGVTVLALACNKLPEQARPPMTDIKEAARNLCTLSYSSWTVSVGCKYGVLAPLWFIGEEYLVLRHPGMSAEQAALNLLAPEVAYGLVALPLGIAIDHFRWSLPLRLRIAVCGQLIVAGSYVALEMGYEPWVCMVALACSWSVARVCALVGFKDLVPKGSESLASGMQGSAMNVIPALALTTNILNPHRWYVMYLLAGLAVVGAGADAVCSFALPASLTKSEMV